jgi:hypothetical protein
MALPILAVLAAIPAIFETVGALGRGLDWLLGLTGVSSTNPIRRTSSTLANLSGVAALAELGEKVAGQQWSAPKYPGWDQAATTAGLLAVPLRGAALHTMSRGAQQVAARTAANVAAHEAAPVVSATTKAAAKAGANIAAKETGALTKAVNPTVIQIGAKGAAHPAQTVARMATTTLPHGMPNPPVQEATSTMQQILQTAKQHLQKANQVVANPWYDVGKMTVVSANAMVPQPPPPQPPPSLQQLLLQQFATSNELPLVTPPMVTPPMGDFGFGNAVPGFPLPPPPPTTYEVQDMPIGNAW